MYQTPSTKNPKQMFNYHMKCQVAIPPSTNYTPSHLYTSEMQHWDEYRAASKMHTEQTMAALCGVNLQQLVGASGGTPGGGFAPAAGGGFKAPGGFGGDRKSVV